MTAPVELPNDNDVFSVKEAAALLREHPKTTYKRLRTGQLEGVQYVKNGRWWVTRRSITEFLRPQRRSA